MGFPFLKQPPTCPVIHWVQIRPMMGWPPQGSCGGLSCQPVYIDVSGQETQLVQTKDVSIPHLWTFGAEAPDEKKILWRAPFVWHPTIEWDKPLFSTPDKHDENHCFPRMTCMAEPVLLERARNHSGPIEHKDTQKGAATGSTFKSVTTSDVIRYCTGIKPQGAVLLYCTSTEHLPPRLYLVGGLEHVLIFPSIGNVIIPTDWNIQRGGEKPPTRSPWAIRGRQSQDDLGLIFPWEIVITGYRSELDQ